MVNKKEKNYSTETKRVTKNVRNTFEKEAKKIIEKETRKLIGENIKKIIDPILTLVHPICAGIDVHKDKLQVCVGVTKDNGQVEYYSKTWYTAYYEDILEIEAFLQSYNCVNLCMESTGIFWTPIYKVLCQTCEVVIVNARQIHAINGKKSDKLDAARICCFYKYGIINGSFIQTQELSEIRNLMRYRRKLVDMRRSESQRFNDTLIIANVRLSSVLKDIFSVTSMKILNYMFEHPGDTDFDVKPLLHHNCKATPEEVKKAIQGGFSECETLQLKEIIEHYYYLSDKIDRIDKEVDLFLAKIDTTQRIKELINSFPNNGLGLKDVFIKTFITEVGTNMDAWENVGKFVAWCGLTPLQNESAGKVKNSKISPAQKNMKPVLVQSVITIVNSPHNSYFKYKYLKLVPKIGIQRARIAIARMIMSSLYIMIKEDKPFDLERYNQIQVEAETQINRKRKLIKPETLSPEEFHKLAIARGYEKKESLHMVMQ